MQVGHHVVEAPMAWVPPAFPVNSDQVGSFGAAPVLDDDLLALQGFPPALPNP